MFRTSAIALMSVALTIVGGGCRLTQPKPYASDPFLKARPPVVGNPSRETPVIASPDYLPPTRTTAPLDPVPGTDESLDGTPAPAVKTASNPPIEDGPRLPEPPRRPMPPLLP